jgi:hypothetical protein
MGGSTDVHVYCLAETRGSGRKRARFDYILHLRFCNLLSRFQALLNRNAKVYLAARSKTKADDAIEWLKMETDGKTPIFLELDLANLDSIRKSVEEFKR